MAIIIVILAILLICSALISGSEVAFFAIYSKDKKRIEQDDPLSKHDIVRRLLENPSRLIATIFIANNFVNIGIVVLSKYISDQLFTFPNATATLRLLIEIIAISSLILLFGEIIPKVYANKKPVLFASFMARTIRFLEKLFYPLASIFIRSLKMFEKKVKKDGSVSLDELSHAIEIASDEIEEERDMLEGIVRFANINAEEVMRSRMDVVAVEINTTFTKLKAVIIDSGFSRIPVFVKTFDDVRGVLYVKDLLPHIDKPASFRWQTLIRQPYFVPENKKINDLLQDFQTKKMHMAIVIDEYGGSSGIITLEDVLEEVVGEITDEYDEEEKWYSKKGPKKYAFEGKTPIDDFEEIMGLDEGYLLEEDMEADSLAGLLLELKGAFPAKDEKIIYKGFTFIPTAFGERRIKQIEVIIDEKSED
ncbi:gliding motility-associated protein GldE [Balneicella halophila]|uniref:Gliding motility-associated protein GldE n=2 Tax=Balneicella halophila TaxID=1537566 RepID=A0A7L4UR39_BALHA|nr:gliding motility-associated protein GldE [Balneicella halophila]